MVSPFTIEEIFPDGATGQVRLPRRQTGSSPQGLAVTLIADYTVRVRAWLPSAAIVALLGEFGVTIGAARTTISRLARRGVLEGSRQGRHSSYRLTQPAAADLSNGGRQIATFAARAESWDGSWTLVAFSMPQGESTRRSGLRGRLRWHGYAPLYDGLWVSPQPMTSDARAMLATVTRGAVTVFRARHVELEAEGSRSPVQAWDMAAIAQQYKAFVRRWSPVLRKIAGGTITGPAAVRARTEVMDTYRRFPVLDPMLPIELMPPAWPRPRARELFVAVYDGLAEPAQEHVRTVVSRVADAPLRDIRAHTIAEMSGGVGVIPTATVAAAETAP